MRRSGAQILVDQLLVHGVETVFCVPGESYLAVLDALRDSGIRIVVNRHEAATTNMAEADGKLTGRPGACFVTRGPGATHASIGLHTAAQDSTPLVLFVGQVPTSHLGREAFQELDYAQFFGGMAKSVAQPLRPDELPEAVEQAFTTAASGRPGPAVVALPEDVQVEQADTEDASPYRTERRAPSSEELHRLRALLAAAERPLIVVGGGGWTPGAADDLRRFAEASELPVAVSFRRQDYLDNRSPSYAGHLTLALDPRLAQRVRDADLLLAIGTRLGEIATQDWTLVELPRPRQRILHVHADARELGRLFEPELAVHAGSPELLAALEPVDGSRWRDWAGAARDDYVANLRHDAMPGDVDLGGVMAYLRERLPEDAVLANGGGNFAGWANRFYEFKRYRTQLAPASGAMGYGLPAAIAAKIRYPERTVVCITGDGDFLMSAQELATAIREDAPVVVLVVDNGMYGTIRMHQERHFPHRAVATDLANPDFAAYARAFGAHGERVERTEEFPEAFERAVAAGRPALLHLPVDPEGISHRDTISSLRVSSLSA